MKIMFHFLLITIIRQKLCLRPTPDSTCTPRQALSRPRLIVLRMVGIIIHPITTRIHLI